MTIKLDGTQPGFDGVHMRSYGPDAGWVDGVYQGRTVQDKPAAAYMVPDGGVLLASAFELEESPSLDGTQATVGTFARYRGEHVVIPVPRAVSAQVTVVLRNPADEPQAVCAVVNDLTYAARMVPPHTKATLSFTVELDRRTLDLTFAPVAAGVLDAGAAGAQDANAAGAADAGQVLVLDETQLASGGTCTVELLSLTVEPFSRAARPCPAIYIAADSLAQTYGADQRPLTGWGEALPALLYPDHAVCAQHDDAAPFAPATVYTGQGPAVHNRAMGGRSAKSFRAERKLEGILRELCPGDVLLIQFGANDATAPRPLRYIPPEHFAQVLDQYLTGAQDRGARPVLITPPPRYHFAPDGTEVLDFAAYADVERAVAAERGIPLIDVSREVGALVQAWGPDHAAALYLKVSAGQYAGYPDGADDSTHCSAVGARVVATAVARGLAAQLDDLAVYDERPAGPVAPGQVTAQVADAADAAPTVELTWDASPANDYYTVEKRDAAGTVLWRTIARAGRFCDVITAPQDATTSYAVTAWRDRAAAAAVTVTVQHAFAHVAAAAAHLAGMSLYEVDDSIIDRTGFSVRFTASPQVVSSYRVVAHNTGDNRTLVLGVIEPEQVGALHSYALNNEPGWEVFVEACDAAGAPLRSRSVAVPTHDAGSGAAGKASWEAPF